MVVGKWICMIPLIAALGIVLARCSFHETSPSIATTSEGGSSASSPSRASTTGGPAAPINVPGIGVLTIRRTAAEGIVIRDKRTGGSRFYLADGQAGECLDFLRANPQPSQEDFAAACPGEQP
jgi:hypothetical protein